MRLIMFGTREDELSAARNWSKQHQIEVTTVEEALTMGNIHLLEGYDGLSTSQTAAFEDEIYQEMNKRGIQQIAQRSAGFDMINLDKATEAGLIVSNVPSYSPSAIAEYAVTAALNIIRNTNVIQKNMRLQDYTWTKKILSRELRSMTVAVIGVGRIGSIAARIFSGFGAEVIAYDIYEPAHRIEGVTYKESLEDAIKEADLITIHMPLTKENYHLFDSTLFNQMKNGVYIVNTARGAIIDTPALIKALDEGKVAAAALDTYENEAPYFPHDFTSKVVEDKLLLELVKRDDVLISPHIAFYTDTAVMNLVEGGLNSAYEVLTTGTCENRVN